MPCIEFYAKPATYPDSIEVREVRVRIETDGFRTKEFLVVTDLLDPVQYSKADLAALFRRRWQAELNLRSLKTEMQMEHLRCKEPHRVRNETRASCCQAKTKAVQTNDQA